MQRPSLWCFVLIAAALLLQLALSLIPGYFSHDELQWAAHADTPRFTDMPWMGWTAFETFQFRPLTFNLWLPLARWLFAYPHAWHALWAALGALNGWMLYRLLRGFGLSPGAAALGFFAFLRNPYAVYVHGWVATLADLLWVGCALAIALLVRASEAGRGPRPPALATAVTALVALALLAKESALCLAPLLALGWWLSGRAPAWRCAFLAACVPTLLYLVLRLDTILFTPRAGDAYGWSPGAPPLRWWEYQLLPYLPTSFMASKLQYASAARHLAAALAWGLLVFALWRGGGWRVATGFLAGGALALGPVLILDEAANQYAYGFAAVTAAAVAVAFARAGRGVRALLIALLVVATWTGVNVQRKLHYAGTLQTRFSPALAAVAAGTPGEIRLYPDSNDPWIFERLSHEIPAYRGVTIGARVHLITDRARATHVIRADGRIEPAR